MDSMESQEVELKEENLLDSVSIEKFTRDGFKTLMECIRHSNALPQEDFSFYNIQESFKKIMSNESNHILSLMNNILRKNGIKSNIKTSVLDHKTELVIEANDTILERVADNIDEINGIKKSAIVLTEVQKGINRPVVNGSWNRIADTSNYNSSGHSLTKPNKAILHKDTSLPNAIQKPQLNFKDKIDNSSSNPWEPRIKDKPNSRKPLAIFLEETDRGEEFSQPYEFELDRFVPGEDQLLPEKDEPVFPKPLDETNFIEIKSANQLDDLLEDLRKYNVIGVDLEHHSYRTFMGITCLMQISTRDTDYVIDTLSLREELCILNEIFTKPSIVKVFHGADSDILWLQRDLSLYVVNMFDTYHAAKLLEYSSLSLAYLLERFCGFKPNKHFQLADWRIRPLSNALLRYAREDTHYLIYIYEMLKIELFKKGGMSDKLIQTVYSRSTDICKLRYFKQRWTEESHLEFYRKCKRMFDNRQLHALKELYKWRDNIAREEDESTGYVLPNHMLLQIAESLPREMQGILACCNPIPPLVRSNLLELHHIILKARDRPLEKSILQEDARAKGSTIKLSKFNIDSPLHCPHDLSQHKDSNDNLPTLLDGKEEFSINKLNFEKSESKYTIFQDRKKASQKPLKKFKFLAPFERYQLVKIFVQDEEKRIAAEKEENNQTQDMKQDAIQLQNLTENKTNEEQIKEYFEKLSKKTDQDEELARKREEQLYQKVVKAEKEQSLIEMGGSKKRKRVNSPVSCENNDEESEKQSDHLNKKHRISDPDEQRNNTFNNKTPSKKKNKNKAKKQTPKNESNKQSSSTPVQINYNRERPNRKRKRDDDSFEAFDYTSVDFRQFQGGAGSVNQGKNIKSKFKNKGKGPNINKAFNKSSMFAKSGKKR